MDSLADNNLQLRMAHTHILDMVQEGAKVLDVGSGGGMLTRAMIERRGCEVICAEIESEKAAASEPCAARTVRALFVGTGDTIEGFERVYTSRKNELLGRLFPNAFAYEFVIKADPAGGK